MKMLKVIVDTDELYMAVNQAGHMYVSKSFLGTGILVSTTRSSILDILLKDTEANVITKAS
jgi:hypothetical protein